MEVRMLLPQEFILTGREPLLKEKAEYSWPPCNY
jgi:hypothetical protein